MKGFERFDDDFLCLFRLPIPHLSCNKDVEYKNNDIVIGDARNIPLPDNVVDLTVTSPPYFEANKEYDVKRSLTEYMELIKCFLVEQLRVLKDGGRLCINISDSGRSPLVPICALTSVFGIMIGFRKRGVVIWDKGNTAKLGTTWGSWMSPSNPSLRDVHEYILIFQKGSFKREDKKGQYISRSRFLELTKSIWRFGTESSYKNGHPAPFPLELPKRCIEFLSFPGDIILDPFCGSGTTCVAARRLKRLYFGLDLEKKYVSMAKDRLGRRYFTLK